MPCPLPPHLNDKAERTAALSEKSALQDAMRRGKVKRAAALKADGMRVADIGRTLGVSLPTVRAFLKEAAESGGVVTKAPENVVREPGREVRPYGSDVSRALFRGQASVRHGGPGVGILD